ncbi:MAG: Na+/H+ antiporter subunit E [Actinomycetota bacterium]|nr:Na+/H+ antiporter subunit E [Actinomycetota bacterium]
MSHRLVPRVLVTAWLTVVWVLLWGGLTVGNVLAGLLLATLLTTAFPLGPDRDTGVHPVALLRFGAHFAVALVQSTAAVARSVLRPLSRLEEGIVAVPLHVRSPVVVSFVANAISLTPGTLTVDIRPRSYGITSTGPDNPTLFVHCLVVGDPDSVRTDAWHLERLAVAAVGTREDRASLAAWEAT